MENRKYKIEYIRYYSPGSEAAVLEPEFRHSSNHRKRRQAAPQAKAAPRVVYIDPLAVVAMCVAVVMVVLMGVGIAQLRAAQVQREQMQLHIQNLQEENQDLQNQLESGYNLEAVEKAALSLGLVPMEEVVHIQVRMEPTPVEEAPEPAFLDRVFGFIEGLFA